MSFDQGRLDYLIDRHLEGRLSESERGELNATLRGNEEALTHVAFRLSDEASMYLQLRSMASGEIFAKDFTVPADFNAVTPKRPLLAPQKQAKKRKRKNPLTYWAAGLAAAAVVGFALFITHLVVDKKNEVLATILSKSAEIKGPVGENGSMLAGDYSLPKGDIEFRFRNGAEVVLKGPTSFRIVDDMRMVLNEGRLSARITEKAKGFTVNTPGLEVVDLGTEFGVYVSNNRETEVHVFSGEVELRQNKEKPIVVQQGFAGRWVDGKADLLSQPDESAFDTPQSLSRRRWEATSESLLQDPAMMAYYDFTSHPGDSSVLRNKAAPGKYDGFIKGASWVTGRWPGTSALQFENKDDGVQFSIPDELKECTISAWIKADRYDSTRIAIFNSDGFKGGCLHFQIMNGGGVSAASNRLFSTGHGSQKLMKVGEWAHCAVSINMNTRVAAAFLNGDQVAAAKITLERPFVIGDAHLGHWASPVSWPQDRDFRGRITEFFILKRALDSKEVRKFYQDTKPSDW